MESNIKHRFGSITNCMNEADLIGGCLDLLDVDEKVVIISEFSYMGLPVKHDASEFIAKKHGAHVIRTKEYDQSVMRNLGIQYLRTKGIEFVFIVDADEWWSSEAMWNAKKWIIENPRYGYKKKFKNMFRRPTWWCVDDGNGDNGSPVCIHINQEMRGRRGTSCDVFPLEIEGHIYHFSYVRRPAKIAEKLANFSHASEVIPNWYEDVFLPATLESRNVHPTNGHVWPLLSEIELPREIKKLMPKNIWI